MSLYRAYFVPGSVDPEGTDVKAGVGHPNKDDPWKNAYPLPVTVYWSGTYCYYRGMGNEFIKTPCPSGFLPPVAPTPPVVPTAPTSPTPRTPDNPNHPAPPLGGWDEKNIAK